MIEGCTKQNAIVWKASSIFEFCYFCCPECDWKVINTLAGKQEFVNHAAIYHDIMELDSAIQDSNPWIASSIFDFSYFCCPECDWKETNTHFGKQDFVNHASVYHTLVSY